jgi:hypothetical protein
MALAKNKTTATKVNPESYITSLPDASLRHDCHSLMKLMKKATGEEGRMWGPSIIGFGTYHYKYESGREGDSPITAFSPRKAAISLYLNADLANEVDRLKELGKHKMSGGCLHIKKLSDVDLNVLEQFILKGVKAMAKQRVK